MLLGEELTDATLWHCKEVLAKWMDFPDMRSISRYQAGFINRLIEVTGSADVLLTNAAWKAYLHPRRQLFGYRQATLSEERAVEVYRAIERSALSNRNSAERAVIHKIGEVLAPHGAWAYTRTDGTARLDRAVENLCSFLRQAAGVLRNKNPEDGESRLLGRIKSNLDLSLSCALFTCKSYAHRLH